MPSTIDITLDFDNVPAVELELAYAAAPPVELSITEPTAPVISIEFGNVGPKGDSWSIYAAIAGQNTSQGRVVYIENDEAFYFDPSDAALYGRTLGVTKNAALTGSNVNVQLSGVMSWPDNNLTPGAVYYVGANGALTTTPSSLIVQRVGHAIAANKLIINFDINILTI